MGHSFGYSVLLEGIRRFRERLSCERGTVESRMRIVGGICLFPGILGLAESPRARQIMSIPYIVPLTLTLSFLIRWITYLLPISTLSSLLTKFLNLPPQASTTTAHFLKRYLERDELNVITTNKRDSENWGAETPSPLPHPRTPLFILIWERGPMGSEPETR